MHLMNNHCKELELIVHGGRPWLVKNMKNITLTHCPQQLIVVQKGASNVYFSNVRSSIYLPQWQKTVDGDWLIFLEKNWRFFT